MAAVVIRADARHLPLPDASVDLIVTSPPYFGLRDYRDGDASLAGQIGSEATPREYVAALLDCTREWVRVLKPSGSMFVNLGDKYSGVGGSNGHGWCIESDSTRERRARVRVPLHQGRTSIAPAKSLMGLPWRYALGCIDDLGLILRAEIIWAKPNGLPESVTDRVRRSHEQVLHFTGQPRYYSAVDEVREPHTYPAAGISWEKRKANGEPMRQGEQRGVNPGGLYAGNPLGKLPGSVWEIASQPLTVPAALGTDHFAAFPMELPRRIIAGWSPPGICTRCGEGRRPVAQQRNAAYARARAEVALSTPRDLMMGGRRGTGAGAASLISNGVVKPEYAITGYACACPQPDAPTRPAIVADPFGGTGTTALVADALGRTGISFDRSADYCRLARWRITDPGERAKAHQVPKPPPETVGQDALFAL